MKTFLPNCHKIQDYEEKKVKKKKNAKPISDCEIFIPQI